MGVPHQIFFLLKMFLEVFNKIFIKNLSLSPSLRQASDFCLQSNATALSAFFSKHLPHHISVHAVALNLREKNVGNRRACMYIALIISFLVLAFKNYVIFYNFFSCFDTQKYLLCYYMAMKRVPAHNNLHHGFLLGLFQSAGFDCCTQCHRSNK